MLGTRTGRAAHHVGGFDDFGDAGANFERATAGPGAGLTAGDHTAATAAELTGQGHLGVPVPRVTDVSAGMGGRFDALVKEWTTDCVGAPAKEKDVMLVVAKKAHGQTRLAELDLRPNRDDVYTKIAQLLTDRL